MSAIKYASNLMSSTVKTLYLDAATADIQFDFSSADGKSERVPAHKLLLSTASVVFRNMFDGTWKRKKVITIDGTPVAALKEFLQIFYLNDIELTSENVIEVIALAKKYGVVECSNICGRFLENNLTDDNECMAYGLAVRFGHDELKRLCEASISIKAAAVLKSPGFLKCDQKTIGHILKLDTLSCSETDVFNACVECVKATSKQDTLTKEAVQAHLGDSFYDIRFGSMKMDEFAAIFESYSMTSLFSAKEHKEIVQMITTEKYKPEMFNGKRRRSNWDHLPMLQFSRNFSFVKDPNTLDNDEETTFSSSEPLLLREI
ncbi:BTB/POZ domain-containing protein 6-B-like, partial [Sitodiplosis mosellana]|uniref:BTB/POZ domain-containing protein 6-B-like n=1 Tax=Sitodiplosis mosellana TaxID=263140 RepID=UPI00244392AA